MSNEVTIDVEIPSGSLALVPRHDLDFDEEADIEFSTDLELEGLPMKFRIQRRSKSEDKEFTFISLFARRKWPGWESTLELPRAQFSSLEKAFSSPRNFILSISGKAAMSDNFPDLFHCSNATFSLRQAL